MESRPRTFCLIRLGALGDLVLVSSLSRELATAGHRVVLVTDRRYEVIATSTPGIERCVLFDRQRHDSLRGLRQLAREVGDVDTVLDLQNKPRTWLLGRQISARHLRSLRLRTSWQFLAAVMGRDSILDDRHQTHINHNILDDVLDSPTPFTPRLVIERAPLPQVALVPGAAHAAKRWPAGRFGELARAVRERGLEVTVIAGPGEEHLVQAVREAAGRELISTLGQGVEAVVEVCRRSALVVGNDSGPAHVAAALGTPVVTLFGPTSWRRWHPLGPGQVLSLELVCQPCSNHGLEHCPLKHHRCLQDLDVGQVLAACLEVLARTRGAPA
ncbi:MAG: glycosyltransferase family 9 protein [Pseudomonadota bacterium]